MEKNKNYIFEVKMGIGISAASFPVFRTNWVKHKKNENIVQKAKKSSTLD